MNLIERRKKLIIFITMLFIVIGSFILLTSRTNTSQAASCPDCTTGILSSTTTKQPTCTAKGTKKTSCDKCSYAITEEIPALGHDWKYENYDDIWHIKYCTRSGCQKNAKEKELHSVPNMTQIKDPTCTDYGKIQGVCDVCLLTVTLSDPPPLGHDYSPSPVITVYPTCEDNGSIFKNCTRCGGYPEIIDTLPALGHDWKYENSDDRWHTKYCTRSGCPKNAKEIESHSVPNMTTVAEPTCTDYGEKEGECTICKKPVKNAILPLGHDWKYEYKSETEHTKRCARSGCPENKEENELHTVTEWTTVKEPTCTDNGVKEGKCTICEKPVKNDISALDHDWKYEYKSETEHTKRCARSGCPENKEENEKHTLGAEATCAKPQTCTKCGETLVEATGKHNYLWTEVKQVTCTVDGVREGRCDVCQKTETETIPATGHKIYNKTNATHHWRECSKCNYEIPETKGEHKFTEFVKTIIQATETSTGKDEMKCNGCSQTKIVTTPKLGTNPGPVDPGETCEHDFSIVKWDDDNHWKICSKCEEKEPDSEKAHTLGEWKENTDGSSEAKCTREGCGYIAKKDADENEVPGDNNGDNNNNNNGGNNGDNNNNNGANNGDNNNNNNGNNNNGNTTANGDIPYAGSKTTIGLIALLAIGGIIAYTKFRKYNV